MAGILLVGGGGHCRAVIDVMELCKLSIAGVIHGPDCALDAIYCYPALGRDVDLQSFFPRHTQAFVTLGQIKTSKIREKLFHHLLSLGYSLPSVSSPLAYISQYAKLNAGSIVMHHALVNAGSTIGENSIINTKALVEHDCCVGSHCHIAVNATLCGGVEVGDGSFIGAGASIMQGVCIGKNCIVGMGCILKKDLADEEIYI